RAATCATGVGDLRAVGVTRAGDLRAVVGAAGVGDLRAVMGAVSRAAMARRRRDPVARLDRLVRGRCVDPEEIATVIARQLEVAGSAAPAEQARATCDLDPAGAQMPGEPIVDA